MGGSRGSAVRDSLGCRSNWGQKHQARAQRLGVEREISNEIPRLGCQCAQKGQVQLSEWQEPRGPSHWEDRASQALQSAAGEWAESAVGGVSWVSRRNGRDQSWPVEPNQ
jgi:hypothetical protein